MIDIHLKRIFFFTCKKKAQIIQHFQNICTLGAYVLNRTFFCNTTALNALNGLPDVNFGIYI